MVSSLSCSHVALYLHSTICVAYLVDIRLRIPHAVLARLTSEGLMNTYVSIEEFNHV